MENQTELLDWFREKARSLPWRGGDRDPYRVWVSEVMLQQTRVETVIPYFGEFLERFPTVGDLAEAREQEVLKVWEGLGFYARARNLHEAAQIVLDEHDGKLPPDRDQLLDLPGIGPATAAAICSFAFDQPVPYLDGNVYRVLSRYTGYTGSTDSSQAEKFFQKWLRERMPEKEPGEFNEALIELGALVCTPSSPVCNRCPLSEDCTGLREGLAEKLPYRDNDGERPERTRAAVIIRRGNEILLVRRPSSGLLGGMWELPGLWKEEEEDIRETGRRTLRWALGRVPKLREQKGIVEHGYSHFQLYMPVFEARVRKRKTSDRLGKHGWFEPHEFSQVPLHGAAEKSVEVMSNES